MVTTILDANTAASAYKFFIPGSQFAGSGNAKDKSGNGADAAIRAAYSDASTWANAGYFTTAAGTDQALTIPLAKTGFNLASQSIILSAVINAAVVGATDYLMGNSVNSTGYGIRLYKDGSGKLNGRIQTTSGAYTLAASTAVFADGTDHCMTFAIDAVTKSAYLWRDGCLSDTYTNVYADGGAAILDFAFGQVNGNPSGTSFAAKFRGAHLLVINGGLPLSMGLLAQRLAGAPMVHLTDMDLAA